MSASPNPKPKPSSPAPPDHGGRHRPDACRGRADPDADGVRLPDRPAPRRGRHPDSAGRRLARPGDARLRVDRPGHDGRDDPSHQGRRPRRQPGARRRGHAVPVVRHARTTRSTAPDDSSARPGPRRSRSRAGVRSARIVETLVKAGIPVMGHIGLTPQSINAIGKVRVQGKSRDSARALLGDALAIQEAGAFSIVLELVPEQLAAAITERLRIPTIGIGAGAGCSGQVQVVTDLLGRRRLHPPSRQAVRRPAGHDPGRGPGVCRRRRRRHLPGSRADRPHGRRGARRGPRPVDPRPPGGVGDPARGDPARPRPVNPRAVASGASPRLSESERPLVD